MTGSMSSEQIQSLIAGYVLCDLSPAEAEVFEQLMAEDPALTEEVEQMQQTLEMAYAPSEIQPPAHLRASILNAHEADYSQVDASVSRVPARAEHRWNWRKGLGAVAALLIVGLSISNYMLWRSLQTAQTRIQPANALTVSLEPTEENSPASATVMLDPDRLAATLQVANLPPLPEGQVYALWTVLQADAPFTTDDKNAILTSVFTVDENGGEAASIALPPVYQDQQWVKAIAITVEAADAPQVHEASPILIVML